MTFQGSVVKEQGITFGIVIVKSHVLNSDSEKQNSIAFGNRAFGRMPIILMAQNSNGIPTYFGKRDIIDFLASVDFRRIPWKEYTID